MHAVKIFDANFHKYHQSKNSLDPDEALRSSMPGLGLKTCKGYHRFIAYIHS